MITCLKSISGSMPAGLGLVYVNRSYASQFHRNESKIILPHSHMTRSHVLGESSLFYFIGFLIIRILFLNKFVLVRICHRYYKLRCRWYQFGTCSHYVPQNWGKEISESNHVKLSVFMLVVAVEGCLPPLRIPRRRALLRPKLP